MSSGPKVVFTCKKCGKKVNPYFREESPYYEARWLPGECVYCKEEEERQKRIESYIQAGISPKFMKTDFSNYITQDGGKEQAKNVKTLKIFAKSFNKNNKHNDWLMLLGNTGTGKNHLAVSIAKVVLDKGFRVVVTKLFNMLNEIKESYAGDQRYSKVIQRFKNVDLLIIDEVSMALKSNADESIFFQIVDHRYETFKPLILVDNLSYEKIKDILGARIIDRFYDSRGKVLIFPWASWRRRESQKV